MNEHVSGPWRERYAGKEVWASSGLICDLVASDFTTQQDCANARLIAAAPDMFTALIAAQELVAVMEGLTACRSDDEFVWGIRDKINAALEKAKPRPLKSEGAVA